MFVLTERVFFFAFAIIVLSTTNSFPIRRCTPYVLTGIFNIGVFIKHTSQHYINMETNAN